METLNKADNALEAWSKPLIFRSSDSTVRNYSASPYHWIQAEIGI
jgi:hypothetical protein